MAELDASEFRDSYKGSDASNELPPYDDKSKQ